MGNFAPPRDREIVFVGFSRHSISLLSRPRHEQDHESHLASPCCPGFLKKKKKRDRWKFNLIRHYKLLDSFDRRRRPSKKIECQSGGLYMLLISFPRLHAIPGSSNKCLSPNKFSRDTRNTLKREAPTPTFSRCLQGVYIVARNIGIGHFDSLVTTQAILGTFLALHTACTSHNTLTTAK